MRNSVHSECAGKVNESNGLQHITIVALSAHITLEVGVPFLGSFSVASNKFVKHVRFTSDVELHGIGKSDNFGGINSNVWYFVDYLRSNHLMGDMKLLRSGDANKHAVH